MRKNGSEVAKSSVIATKREDNDWLRIRTYQNRWGESLDAPSDVGESPLIRLSSANLPPANLVFESAATSPRLPLGLRRMSPALFSNYRVYQWVVVIAAIVVASPHSWSGGLGVATPDQFSAIDGFEIELLYEVPGQTQGSWVSLTTDPKGRLITCDQYGGLFRIDVSDPPTTGSSVKGSPVKGSKVKVEKLQVEFEGAQGLLCAFGSLYANVNSRDQESGVYRLTDTNGDDQYDQVEHLIKTNGGSEHGPHALILTPDKKRILMVAGNSTDLPKGISRSRVPSNYQEDHLLGRMPDARGHNAKRMAPGGYVLSFDPDGSNIEFVANGFRNHYDIALNREGELFTYDADMEWDVGTPWYRPTRVNHVISGGEYGWRNGTGKWPAYYPDSFGSAVDIGPGSPTGICFGYGAKFPAKYQNALFICDWSYGNIHAVHLNQDGSTYSGSFETFATAAPLPVTDLLIHPDGNLYFTVGGRKTQSGLYRVRYVGNESTAPVGSEGLKSLANLRRSLEDMHLGGASKEDLATATANLGHADRGIRYAARVAIENHGADAARDAIKQATTEHGKIIATVGLARTGKPSDRATAMATLQSISWDSLPANQRIDLLRAYALIAIRLDGIEGEDAAALAKRLSPAFPTGNNEVDRELAQVLVYLNDETAIDRIVKEMKNAPSQENQIHYALTLRNATKGWSDDSRRDYFQWFNDISTARGGMSFGGFLANIKAAAVTKLEPSQKEALAKVLNPPKKTEEVETKSRPLVQKWTVGDLEKSLAGIKSRPNFERGKEVFADGQCYKCHRMGIQGGILGPNLTSAGGKFGVRDMLITIVEPSKEVSDQYGATQFLMDDGRVITGRIVNMRDNKLQVMTNMLDPAKQTVLDRDGIESARESPTSMMPSGLLDVFTADEIADLIAYLRAGGQPNHPIYQKSVASN